MTGLFVALLGYVAAVVGLVLLVGVWPLIPCGVVLMAVGLFVDLDRVKEPQRAKRSQSAP